MFMSQLAEVVAVDSAVVAVAAVVALKVAKIVLATESQFIATNTGLISFDILHSAI
jgi:hypothetical protein